MQIVSGAEVRSGGAVVRVHGALVPIAAVELAAGAGVYFEHHIVLAKDPSVELALHPLGPGLARRLFGGLPLMLMEARGPGSIAFSRDGVGEMVALELDGQEVDVLEHRFVCASREVSYGYKRIQGLFNMFGSGSGFWMDRFGGHGLLVLHAYGNVVERTLAAGEAVDVDPGAWLYKDPGVAMQMHLVSLRQGLFASSQGFTMARFTGPGRIAYQSLTPLLAAQPGA